MPLPSITCPNCHAAMSLDVALADDAPREALAAIIDAHPAGDAFVKPLLRYIGLFAPARSHMGHARMAALIRELVPMIRAAQFARAGRAWVCPIELWEQGFAHMLALRDEGRLTKSMQAPYLHPHDEV